MFLVAFLCLLVCLSACENISLHIIIVIYPMFKFKEHHKVTIDNNADKLTRTKWLTVFLLSNFTSVSCLGKCSSSNEDNGIKTKILTCLMICSNLLLLECTKITERSTCHGRVDTHGDDSTQHTRY